MSGGDHNQACTNPEHDTRFCTPTCHVLTMRTDVAPCGCHFPKIAGCDHDRGEVSS